MIALSLDLSSFLGSDIGAVVGSSYVSVRLRHCRNTRNTSTHASSSSQRLRHIIGVSLEVLRVITSMAVLKH